MRPVEWLMRYGTWKQAEVEYLQGLEKEGDMTAHDIHEALVAFRTGVKNRPCLISATWERTSPLLLRYKLRLQVKTGLLHLPNLTPYQIESKYILGQFHMDEGVLSISLVTNKAGKLRNNLYKHYSIEEWCEILVEIIEAVYEDVKAKMCKVQCSQNLAKRLCSRGFIKEGKELVKRRP